ncbi:hypothetical protein [Nocardioides sp. YIM 152588]|uniref:hypothetical protein n=1 Tax=Nocardioides sp. YIM 152588 TaxID=3158259 RepID=UPI0032E5290B
MRPRLPSHPNPLILVGGVAAVAALLFGIVQVSGTSAPGSVQLAHETTTVPTPTSLPSAYAGSTPDGDPGRDAAKSLASAAEAAGSTVPTATPTDPVTEQPESDGRTGSGLAVGAPTDITAPVGFEVRRRITTAVANIPNRTSNAKFAASMRKLTADSPDFVLLNEVSKRSMETILAKAPGYDGYRDPAPDQTLGGNQSMNNVVVWRDRKWDLLDAGRVKLVDDDTGYSGGKKFTWDRYATWTMLQRRDGAIVSVVSTHMMTNPARFPRQHGKPTMTRVQRYGAGMDVLVETVRTLAAHGPVLVGGDMNSHPNQGAWSAAPKMAAAGFTYTKDRGVMYLFAQDSTRLKETREMRIASDHPALVTTIGMRRTGPTPAEPTDPTDPTEPTEPTS